MVSNRRQQHTSITHLENHTHADARRRCYFLYRMTTRAYPKFYRAEIADGIPQTKKYLGVVVSDGKYMRDSRQLVFDDEIRGRILDMYDDPATGYIGRDKLYRKIIERYEGISRRDVAAVLAAMETQQVHATPPQTKINRPIVPKRPYERLAADLVFITNGDNEPLFTLLTCVDVFTKFAWVRKCINKKAATTAAAMSSILESMPQAPGAVLTDRGTEFQGKFDELLDDHSIKHLTTEAYSPRQNSMVERFNRTIKTRINKYLTHANGVTISDDDLAKLVHSYNTSEHATTKTTPAKLAAADADPRAVKSARRNIKTRAERLLAANAKSYPEVKPGDAVRVAKRTEGAWRKYTSLKKYSYQRQWFPELYTVVTRTTPTSTKAEYYRLKRDGKIIRKNFLRADLMLVDRDTLIREMAADEYAVEKVLDVRKRKGANEYLVRWRGHDEESWIPYNESFSLAVAEFDLAR